MPGFQFRLILGALLVAVSGPLHAQVRIAFLQADPQQTGDLTTLAESRLSGGARNVAFVERQQIDKLLHEQHLQAMLGDDAPAGRAKIGKLLQADLLVFIRRQDESPPVISVVISETHHGLRLLREAVDPADSEKAAAAIGKFVAAAIAKNSAEATEILAVPPFVDDGLGFEFAYLQGAYARLIEGFLARQKGVLLADLSEARAIANEITLSSADNVERPLPLYVLGSFRNDTVGGERRVQIKLKLMRGDKLVSSIAKGNLAPPDVPDFLREAAASMLSQSKGAAPARLDSQVEAEQLASQARVMKQLGSYHESLDLIEASLLLNPSQPMLHLDAVELLAKYTEDTRLLAAEPALNRPIGAARCAAYLEGLRHLEPYLRSVKLDRTQRREAEVISHFATSMDAWANDLLRDRFLRGDVSKGAGALQPASLDLLKTKYLGGRVGPFWEEFLAARKTSSSMFYRVLHAKSQARVADDTLWHINAFDNWGCILYLPEGNRWYSGVEPAKRHELHLGLLSEFSYLPNEGDYLPMLLDYAGMQVRGPRDVAPQPALGDFLRKAKEVDNDSLRKKADELLGQTTRKPQPPVVAPAAANPSRQRVEQPRPAAAVQIQNGPLAKPSSVDDVRFVPIPLKLEGGRSPLPILGWLPAGDKIDFAWNGDNPLLMKEPGILRRVNGLGSRIEIAPKNRWQVQFDGKYVWALYDAVRKIKLLVIDPQAEKVICLDAVDSLPASDEMAVAPLRPGTAAVLGYFGQGFVATIEIGKDAKPITKILHEFRHLPQTGDADQWHDTETIFHPAELFALSAPASGGGQKQALIAWRGGNERSLALHPIVIDVSDGSARALEEQSFATDPLGFLPHDGVVDQIDRPPGTTEDVLRRFALAGVASRPLGLRTSRATSLVMFGGALHCVESHWIVADPQAGPFRQLKATYPSGEHWPIIFPSEHYGLVGFVNQVAHFGREPDINLYQVEFSRPPLEYLKSP